MAKVNSSFWENDINGWVFLSHSHKDYEEVKIVRNYLEENNFNAIMFYLRCFNYHYHRYNVSDIIKCEINSRNIFVLCDSENAKKSKWVKKEVKYVKRFSHKIYKEIDIKLLKYKKCTQLSKLDDLMNMATLYFLYASQDKPQVNKIREKLNILGYRIFKDIPSSLKKNFHLKIKDALQETIDKGAVLIFLSQKAKESKWFWKEKSMALDSNAFIIPIILDDVSIDNFPAFRHLQYINMKNINDKTINELLEIINKKER